MSRIDRYVPPDAEVVIYRLEAAGRASLALPDRGPCLGIKLRSLEIVTELQTEWETDRTIRPAMPSAAEITLMDEALAWISLIPPDLVTCRGVIEERHHVRRVVGLRSLISPITDRHVWSWRKIANRPDINANKDTVAMWHARGIDQIVRRLRHAKGAPPARMPRPAGYEAEMWKMAA